MGTVIPVIRHDFLGRPDFLKDIHRLGLGQPGGLFGRFGKEQLHAAKAAVFDHQDSPVWFGQASDPGKDAHGEVFCLTGGASYGVGAQRQSDILALVAQVAGKRAVAIYTLVGVTDHLLLVVVDHHEGVDSEAHIVFIGGAYVS